MAAKRNLTSGLTLLEVILTIVAVLALVSMILPLLARAKGKSSRISCVNCLKQVGTAYRVWAGDNGNHMPAATKIEDGGWNEYLLKTNAAAFLWTNYAVMANELGQSPRVLICPDDANRSVPTNFTQFGDNRGISYFAGVNASDTFPQSILGGDRNLAPGIEPKDDFGFSSKDNRGNDVTLRTNSPVCWSLKFHSSGNRLGSGNLLLGDGSVTQTSSGRLRADYLPNAGVPPNPLDTNSSSSYPSFRLLFP